MCISGIWVDGNADDVAMQQNWKGFPKHVSVMNKGPIKSTNPSV